MNPVNFSGFEKDEDFTPYMNSLSEFAWKDQLVGLTSRGLLYVDEKVSRTGHYEFFPKLLGWAEISEVRIRTCLGWKGIALGLFALTLAVCAFIAGWIDKSHVGPGIVTIPLVGGVGGVILLAGARRHLIRVHAKGRWLRWMSQPLAFRRSVSLVTELVGYCQREHILHNAHAAVLLNQCQSDKAEAKWQTEANEARLIALERGIDHPTIDSAVKSLRYGS